MGYEINLGNGEWATGQGGMAMTVTDTDTGVKEALLMGCDRNAYKTAVNKNGLLYDVLPYEPSVTYVDGVGVLNNEPQATNLVLTSAEGVYGNPPASEIFTESPQGLNNAVRPVPDSASGDRYEYTITPNTFQSGDEIVYSWYRKRISTPTGAERIGDLDFKSLVNLSSISGSKKQIESNINGFDRFQGSFTVNDGSLESKVRAYFGEVIGVGNSSVAYFGHQVEQGSVATSYIPTNGATQTRLADTGFQTPDISKWINKEEGTVIIRQKANNTNTDIKSIGLSNGTVSERIYIGVRGGNELRTVATSGGQTKSIVNTDTIDNLLINEIAFTYSKSNNIINLYSNNMLVGSVDMPTSILDINSITFSTGSTDGMYFGDVFSFKYYNYVLTEQQIINS